MKKISVLVLVALLIWAFWHLSSRHPGTITEEPVSERVSQELTVASGKQPDKVTPTENNWDPGTTQPRPANQLFHDDLVIDSLAGMFYFAPCQMHWSNEPSDQTRIAQLKPEQKMYLDPFFEACDEDKGMAKAYSKEQIMTRMAEMGPEMHRMKSRYDKDLGAAKIALTEATGYEILATFVTHQKFFNETLLEPVSTLLGAHDQGMVRFVIDQVLILRSCETGVDCSYASGVMMSRCVQDVAACGLSYPDYVANQFSPGLRTEIQMTQVFLHDHLGW